MIMNGSLIGKKEVMEYLNCSKGTIDNWMKSGKLEYIKIGRLVRFDKEIVDRDIRKFKIKR
mgnify:CR=1 FL=1|jgi:excisionase family DNA binding protein